MGFYNTIFNFDLAGFSIWFDMYHVYNGWVLHTLAAIACAIVFVVSVLRERGVDVNGRVLALPLVVRVAIYAVCGTMVIAAVAITKTSGAFLYANF